MTPRLIRTQLITFHIMQENLQPHYSPNDHDGYDAHDARLETRRLLEASHIFHCSCHLPFNWFHIRQIVSLVKEVLVIFSAAYIDARTMPSQH
jgi:hypothetical protein